MTTFHIEVIITATGTLDTDDINALHIAVGDTGTVLYDRTAQQVHLSWTAQTDSMSYAMESARSTYATATDIIGLVLSPERVVSATIRHTQDTTTAPRPRKLTIQGANGRPRGEPAPETAHAEMTSP